MAGDSKVNVRISTPLAYPLAGRTSAFASEKWHDVRPNRPVLGYILQFYRHWRWTSQLGCLVFLFQYGRQDSGAEQPVCHPVCQLARLITSLMPQTVPDFVSSRLVFMIVGGICGGMLGCKILRRLTNRGVEKIFITVMVGIVLVNIYNVTQFLGV